MVTISVFMLNQVPWRNSKEGTDPGRNLREVPSIFGETGNCRPLNVITSLVKAVGQKGRKYAFPPLLHWSLPANNMAKCARA